MDGLPSECPRKRTFDEIQSSSSNGCPFSQIAKRVKEEADISDGEILSCSTSPEGRNGAEEHSQDALSPSIVSDPRNSCDQEEEEMPEIKVEEDDTVNISNHSPSIDESAAVETLDEDMDDDDIDNYLEAGIEEELSKERGEYKHKPTRVCTFSRPYNLGQGSVRHHKVPPAAIPCLYQKRLIKEEENNAKAQKEYEDRIAQEALVDRSSAVMHEINAPMVNVKDAKNSVDGDMTSEELRQYASQNNTFEFTTVKYRRYKEWKDARKHFKDVKKLNSDKAKLLNKFDRPVLPSDIKLITVPSMEASSRPTARQFVLNPKNKTALTLLHEYAQTALKSSVIYDWLDVSDPLNPYQAIAKLKVNDAVNQVISQSSFRERFSVIQEEYKIRLEQGNNPEKVDQMKGFRIIGRGSGKSKKAAKMNSAVAAVRLLLPDIEFDNDGIATSKGDNEDKELELFDLLDIEDTKISEYSHRTGQPQPYAVLQECLSKAAHFSKCPLIAESKKCGYAKMQFTIKIGDKHEVTASASSVQDSKQLAAQKMLKIIYPQFTKYGSILRIYGSHVKLAFKNNKRQQREFQNRIATLKGPPGTSGGSKQPKRVAKNFAYVNAVRKYMLQFAENAKEKNTDILYKDVPLTSDKVEDANQACKKYFETNPELHLQMIPKI